MEFEWDDTKSGACFTHRGFDFAYVLRAFLDEDRIVGRDRRWDYGEERYRLLGAIEGRVDLRDTRFGHPHHFSPQGQRKGGSRV